MVQVIRRTPQAPRKNKGQQFAEAFSNLAQAGTQHLYQKTEKAKKDAALSKYLGAEDVSDLDEKSQLEILKQAAKAKSRQQLFNNIEETQNGAQNFANDVNQIPLEVQTGQIPANEFYGTSPTQKVEDLKNQLDEFQYEGEEDYERPTKPKPIQIPPYKPPHSEQKIKSMQIISPQDAMIWQRENEAARKQYDNEVNRINSRNENQLNRQQRESHFNKEFGLKKKKTEQDEKKYREEKKEKTSKLDTALKSVKTMKNIRKKGNLGIFSKAKGILSSQVRKDRGKYVTLGNSLLSFASSIPVRNRLEFETLTGKINDPNITDAEALGVLESLEDIIKGSMNSYENDENLVENPNKKNASRPSVTDFM